MKEGFKSYLLNNKYLRVFYKIVKDNKKHRTYKRLTIRESIIILLISSFLINPFTSLINFMGEQFMFMLKFDIIESQHRKVKNKIVDLMTKKMNLFKENEFSLNNCSQSTFIITDHKDSGMRGGACLLKKSLSKIQEDIRELIPIGDFPEGYVWECITIHFEIAAKYQSPDSSGSAYLHRKFYRDLYERLVQFGKVKGIRFIIMKLTLEEYTSTVKFGLWPYIVKFNPTTSPDALFYGILPLIGNHSETYQKLDVTFDY